MKPNRLTLTLVASLLLLCTPCVKAAERVGSERNALKITFLSWATGSTKLSYERAFEEWRQSGELCGSIISAGYDGYHNRPVGFTLRYGHKFFIANYTPTKPLDGLYLRPEAIYCRYHYDHPEGHRALSEMGALLATAGYQLTWHRWIVDGWVGAGYGYGTAASTGYQHGFRAWPIGESGSHHLALSFSIRVGLTF